ncbi:MULTISPECIES: hypothetical protein [Rhizobium/Agrobacterium group]|uniref:Uncharacterized protein n=2 Tax=Rhizobium/Agrobacterium group TaxID=227290 RepID=B9JWP0_ALLAM|nr:MULTISPECIES: hypothetical protein [Rhizobium/Agrobacterium group]ACM36668.1 hypothetical protein Avi_2340 [Allorhizobium ampelinum S4]MUO27423.1 hypothetical protein [Agrobacterium vitis]MUO42127.1 hypothetical protein [Agrobacterium vitis]MUP09435.1 hypothetical protein [Agrobacterium vitis]
MRKHDSKTVPGLASHQQPSIKPEPLVCLLADVEGKILSIQRIVCAINDLLVIEDPETTYRRNKSALELAWYLEGLVGDAEKYLLTVIETQERNESREGGLIS